MWKRSPWRVQKDEYVEVSAVAVLYFGNRLVWQRRTPRLTVFNQLKDFSVRTSFAVLIFFFSSVNVTIRIPTLGMIFQAF